MNKFKPGDVVICHDNSEVNRLVTGKLYVVAEGPRANDYLNDYPECLYIDLKMYGPEPFFTWRFVLVKDITPLERIIHGV